MALKLIDSKEEILKIDRNFWKFATKSLDESEFFYVNFSFSDTSKNVEKVKVIYSESNSIFFARFKREDVLKYAFGFYDSDLQLSLTNFVPLNPSFIFEFNLNSQPKQFESVFASQESKIHLMLKVYGLSNKQVRYLRREGFSLLKEPKFDFYLLDFGSFKPFSKFLKIFNKSKSLKFGTYENKATIITGNKIKSKKPSKYAKNKETKENNSKIPSKKENGQYSLYKGVSFNIDQLKWISTYRVNNRTNLVGYFDTEEEYWAREEYIKKIEKSEDKKQKSKTVKGKKKKPKSSKYLKKIPKKNSRGNFSEYDEISFDVDSRLWTAHFNNKFLGYFQSEEQAHTYRFNYIMSIPIPPLRNNGRYSLHKGVDFDKVYRCWYAKADKKIIGKFNSEKEAIEALKKYDSAITEDSIVNLKGYGIKLGEENQEDKNINESILELSEENINSKSINNKKEDLIDKQNNITNNLISDKRNIFLVDYNDEFIYVALKFSCSKYDSSIFNFIDVNNLSDMIWDKKNNGTYDVIINLVFTKDVYKKKLGNLLKFDFDNSDKFIPSLDFLNHQFNHHKKIIERNYSSQFSEEKQKMIFRKQEKLKKITATRLEKEKNEQITTDELMVKLDKFIGIHSFNEDFINLLNENDLTIKNGNNIKKRLEKDILFEKITLEEFERRLNEVISDEISYKSKKNQERINRESRGLNLRNNFEMINQRNKNLESFYLKFGKDGLNDEFRYKLKYYGLSEDIGYNIKKELINLILNDQLDISDLDSKFNELLNNEKNIRIQKEEDSKNKVISDLLDYSDNYFGKVLLNEKFRNRLMELDIPIIKGYSIKKKMNEFILNGEVSLSNFESILEDLFEEEKKTSAKYVKNEDFSSDTFLIIDEDASEKSILCPKCHQELRGDENFCIHCGHSLKCYCPNCGHENDSDNNFCVNCGYEL